MVFVRFHSKRLLTSVMTVGFDMYLLLVYV